MVQEKEVSVAQDCQSAGGEGAAPWPWGYLVPMAGVRYYMFLDGPEEATPPVPAQEAGLAAGAGEEV